MDSTLDKTCSQSSDDADSNDSFFSAHSSTPSPSNFLSQNEQFQPSESEIKHSDSINMSPHRKLPSQSITVKAPESNLPRGFVVFVDNKMPKNTMIVYFKAVLRKDDWSWDEYTSKVYIRFRHKDLGGMKYDHGPGSINRFVDNYIIVNFTVYINRNVICSAAAADTLDLSYKYVVQISQEKSVECLLCAPHDDENTNRVLRVSKKTLLSDKVVVVKQYDTFILSENTKTSKAWMASISKLWNSSSFHKTVDDMRAECLELHLGPSKDLLLRGNFHESFDVNTAAMGVFGVVDSSYCQHYDNASGVHDWINHKVLNEFKVWIRGVMEAVCKDENLKSSLKMASAVVLVCCNTVFKTQRQECITLTDELSVSMLKTLQISPDGEEYSFLQTLMKEKQSRHLVLKSLAELLQDIICRKLNPTTITYLLKALPLLHFVRLESVPHQPLKLSPREINWKDRVLNFDMIKPYTVKNQKTKWFMGVYSEVEPLFQLDPLLPFAVAYICPCIEVPELCQKMHLPYAIAFVAKKLSQHLDRTSKETDVALFESLTVLSQQVKATLIDKQQLEHCFEGAHLLLDGIDEQMEVLCKQNKDVECVTLSIALMLYLTEKDDTNGHWETAKPAIKKLLKCCVKKRGYGDTFGGRSKSTEMQFWESILKQMTYSSHLVLEWNRVVEEIIKERVEKVEVEVRIRLFSELEKRAHTPSLLTNIFMAEATAALDELVLKNKEHNSLEVLMTTMSDNIRKILGGLLKKKYPKVNDNTSIPLEDLLEWELWSGFINLYATRNKVLTEARREKWYVICACALSTLEDVCKRVEYGNISITELRKIENRKGQMNKLCKAAVFECDASVLPVDKFNEKFKQRVAEYDHFEHYRKGLKLLLEHLSTVNVQGVEELREAVKFEDEYKDRPINSLCIEDNGRYHVTCFPTAAPLEPCLNRFWRMACSEEKCDYFFRCWTERLVFVTKMKVILTPEKVVSEIWQPVFAQCQTLHKQLIDCSLLLSEVDRVFKGQKSDEITKNLTQLHLGVAEHDEDNIQWIDEVVKRMEHYWKLCQYAEAARAFLNLIAVLKLDSLKYSEEYKLLEHVSDCLMEGQTLRNIVEYDMSVAVILEEYATDKKKRDCLTAFAECQEIVTWIRRETNGIEDLQSFVTIALATAVGGEDDLTKDKLSNLRTVGSGFRALIYELPYTTKPTSLLAHVNVEEQACALVTGTDSKTQIVSQIDTEKLLLIEPIGGHNNENHTTSEQAVNESDVFEHGLGFELPLNNSSSEYDSDKDDMYYYHSASSSDQLEDMLSNNSANQGNNDQQLVESASEANGDREVISPIALINTGSDENLSSNDGIDQEDMPPNELKYASKSNSDEEGMPPDELKSAGESNSDEEDIPPDELMSNSDEEDMLPDELKSASESNSDEEDIKLFDFAPSNGQEDDILKLKDGEPKLNDSCSEPENRQEVLSHIDLELLFADKPSSEQKDEFSHSQLELDIEPKIRWKELLEICRTLWEFLKTTPNLPDLMRNCEQHVSWYTSVKETQGSVEVTSFGQMRTINKYGCYCIGSSMKTVHVSQSQVIQLKVETKKNGVHKNSYSLDDLTDLESKLVLITGRDSKEVDEVDKFLKVLSLVRRIADTLIVLQQYGNGAFIGWELQFHSFLPHIVEDLQKIAYNMETALDKWKEEIDRRCNAYYELNYFTSQQLLLLREELGRLKNSEIVELSPVTLSLLQSVSRLVTSENVKDTVEGMATLLEETHDGVITHQIPQNVLFSASIGTGCNQLHQRIQAPASSTSAIMDDMLKNESSKSDVLLPFLQEETLTKDQQSILINLKEFLEYPQKLILLAFERCENPNSYDEVQAWCEQNSMLHEYDVDDSRQEAEIKDDLTTGSYSEEEPEEMDEDFESKLELESQTYKEENLRSKITVKDRLPVDENHPVVKKLLNLDYPLTDCLKAAHDYPDDIDAAHRYLEETGDQGELFGNLSEAETLIKNKKGFQMVPSGDSNSQCSNELETANESEYGEITIWRNPDETYLSLLELGELLRMMSNRLPRSVFRERHFPEKILKIGEPNLIVVTPPNNLLKTVLSIYMDERDQSSSYIFRGQQSHVNVKDQSLPMPTYEEVLMCSKHTTLEEVKLLWKRALGDPQHHRIFCLVHAEKLSHKVCEQALQSLSLLSEGKREYKIVVICSGDEEEKSYIIAKLKFCRRYYSSSLKNDSEYAEYLMYHFKKWPETATPNAASVDSEKSCVRVVTSKRGGMGKSLYIKRRKEKLMQLTSQEGNEVIVPLHGPLVTADNVVEALKEYIGKNGAIIFHLDIASNVLWQVDAILFSLLVLHGLCDSQGRVWRCQPTHLYMIEATLPMGTEAQAARQTLEFFNLLPCVQCVSPKQLLENVQHPELEVPFDEKLWQSSSYQRVFQYLNRHKARVNLDQFRYIVGSVEGNSNIFLQVVYSECGVIDPSWAELNHFIQFLNVQLSSCEASVFCNQDALGDSLPGFKSFVVKFMIKMSKDFVTSSLCGEVAKENEEKVEMEKLEEYEIAETKKWEKNYHPYLFFNGDHNTLTFVGFNVNEFGDLVDPSVEPNATIETRAMRRQLFQELRHNMVDLHENYYLWNKSTMMEKMCKVLDLQFKEDPDPSYVLTPDNLIKIFALIMRFRCNIPVLVMGETGCGKTRLIRYLCDMVAKSKSNGQDTVKNMLIMKVHGGTTEEDVVMKVMQAEELAEQNKERNIDTILFFDEANTTEAIGLIKEVMCDRRVYGREISENVKFVAACNPYRKHRDEMIKKLESAGLGFYVKATQTQQKLGKLPLRQLVYRVLDLPASMKPLVYDFGKLTSMTEKDYTRQIVHNYCKDSLNAVVAEELAHVLAWCQDYMRKRVDECSFVSLRDVERTMIVFHFFREKFNLFRQFTAVKAEKEKDEQIADATTWALILAIAVCYHARLQERTEFEKTVVKEFRAPLQISRGAQQFCNEIRWCQEVLLEEGMITGPNIANNAALRENVFMMTICIELRIPLFLVGKPGSSKSLAKSIVANSMHGKASSRELMKNFKEVHMLSYQCSQHSTSQSIIDVFKTAKSFQKNQNTSKYVSVVVLDEVGLAEDSPNLPLKALHPLLEDGTDGADNQQIINREERVAFVGISNWALDPAKMNRGVMVLRDDPKIDELKLSARGICSNIENDPIKEGRTKPEEQLKDLFEPLADAYNKICTQQERSFFGLRDFYSLIKMLYWMCERTSGLHVSTVPTSAQLEHAIKRNFGGKEDLDAITTFMETFAESKLNIQVDDVEVGNLSTKQHAIAFPDCTPLGLIRTSLKTKETTWHGENRYLLFLTENSAALEVLKHYLQEAIEQDFSSTPRSSTPEEFGSEHKKDKMEPFVLFGSSFRKDKEYTQVCRNINQIKVCMEAGRTVILLNLENIYESLYDLLNQYYIRLGDTRYVDLGLQTHRVKCRVHNDFKLILIAEKHTVYEKFPIPLINRLEKHLVVTRNMLFPWQETVLSKLVTWAKNFNSTTRGRFTEKDSFVGYQNDTPAAVVFQATAHLRKKRDVYVGNDMEETWKEEILQHCKELLLQMATPDSIIRLKCTDLADQQKEISKIYSEQCHGSIGEFLCHMRNFSDHNSRGLLLQVTTHSHLLSIKELEMVRRQLKLSPEQMKWYLLQDFDTEMDFSSEIKTSFERRCMDECWIIIQCASGHLCGDLIACARYRVDDEREKACYRTQKCGRTHVLFVIHLPRQGSGVTIGSSFVSFQGGKWLSAHIDDLRAYSESPLSIDDALSTPVSDVFYNMGFISSDKSDRREVSEIKKAFCQCSRLYDCTQAAVAEMIGSKKRKDWASRVKILLSLIPHHPEFPLDECSFFGALVKHIHGMLLQREGTEEDAEWVFEQAMNRKNLHSGGTFWNALSRRLDEIITPMFAWILLYVDNYSNLDLLKKDSPSYVIQFWLSVFRCQELCQFNYAEMATQGLGKSLAVTGHKIIHTQEFCCQFPFFWLIKDVVDSHLDSATHLAGSSHRRQVHLKLCELLAGTRTGEILASVNDNLKEFYQFYLHDFVKSVHQVLHDKSTMEYEIIEQALNAIVSGPDLSPKLPTHAQPNLLSCVAAVHVVFFEYQRELLLFGQLVSHMPGILVHLQDRSHSENALEIHLHAVGIAIKESLKPPLTTKDKNYIPQWLVRIQLSQGVIDSILAMEQGVDQVTISEWQRARAVRMFAEHVVMKYDNLDKYWKRLYAKLSKCNFKTAKTVLNLQETLKSMEGELQRSISSKNKLQSIRKSCKSFFIQVVSNLCFSQPNPPESDLFMLLLKNAFDEKKASYSLGSDSEKEPIIQSFLLQLLLDHNYEDVKVHLEEYLEKSQKVMDDNQLYLLCIQCFEDSLFKMNGKLPLQRRIDIAQPLLENGTKLMREHTKQPKTFPYLVAVANLRFALSVVAELVHHQEDLQTIREGNFFSDEANNLIEEAKLCCSCTVINEEEAGPAVYLVKLLARKYGSSFISRICRDTASSWVVPGRLMVEEKQVDMFVIYGPVYQQLRQSLAKAVNSQHTEEELQQTFEDLTPEDAVPLVLVFYRIVTQRYTSALNSLHSLHEMAEKVWRFSINNTTLNRELKWIAQTLLRNTQGDKLDMLCCRPNQSLHTQFLSAVVVHTTLILTSKRNLGTLQPLTYLLCAPAKLQKVYLPTMPQDFLAEARKVLARHDTWGFMLGGSFYECPRGHIYYVSECGMPMMEYVCNECGAKIGGTDHKALPDQKLARQTDDTKTGYALGSPKQREVIPSPERSLSPAACAIIRAIMHSALIWASSNNENVTEDLILLTHNQVEPRDLPKFFWNHLEKDVKILEKALGKNEDDVCLLLHLVLKRISVFEMSVNVDKLEKHAKLQTVSDREEWESWFQKSCILPVLTDLDKQLEEAMELCLNDKKVENDQLLNLVYEKSSLPQNCLLPHFWTYRSRVTLEHLFQTLQAQNMKKHYPILYEFLQKEPILRATKCLPELVKLQKHMHAFSHRRIDRSEAATLTVGAFINRLSGQNKRSFQNQLQCVGSAWSLVKDKLAEYARIPVKKEHLIAFSENITLEFLIPTFTGPGVVTVALLDLLVRTHNNFLENARTELRKRQKMETSWKDQKVPVQYVQQCHLLDYEHHLLSIVLSQCQFSLKHGQGQDISYNLAALEKDIVDRFIHGKPYLILEIPQVVYRKGVYTAASFVNIRKKVSPQVKLSLTERTGIINELGTMQNIRACLDVVEIAMGFLATGAQNANNSLGDYIDTALRMKKRLNSEKVREHCNLSHVMSLWETLSVELAKQLTLANQEPFDSLNESFLVELDGDATIELDQVLHTFDLPLLLGTLYEFIQTNVAHREHRESEWDLVNTLEAHLEHSDLGQLPGLDELPDSITIGQAASTWKHIVIYQHKKSNNLT